jgi:glycosyltransferase involved in cell wall biosynthesis
LHGAGERFGSPDSHLTPVRLVVDASAASSVGAAHTRLCELARELPLRTPQHQVAFVVRPKLQAEIKAITAGSASVISPRPRVGAAPVRVAWQLTQLPRLTRPFRPDVVFSLFNILAARWPSPRPRLAVMVSHLAPFSEEIRRSFRLRARPRDIALLHLTRSAVENADLAIFQSLYGLETVSAACAVDRHLVIPHRPPVPDEVAPSRALVSGTPYVAIVANRYPYKGIETVVEALARITADVRPRVALVGTRGDPAYAMRIDRLVALLGLGRHVVDLGPLSHKDTLGVIAGATACVACSRFENLSRIPGEAMALGTPLIATDIPPHREAADGAALYYRPGDADELATAMRSVLGSGTTRARLVAAGNARTERARRADPIGEMIAALEELAA